MASKNDNLFDDWSDFDDFDDFEMNGGRGDFKSTTKKGKAREAITALSGGLVSGVKESLFSRNFHQTIVKAALPKEYSSALDKSLEVKDGIEELYDSARREVEDSNDKLAKGVKPIVDKYGDKLPKRMARPLRKWTSNVRSSADWTTENKDELETVAALNDIFSKREQTKSAKNTSMHSMVQTGIAKASINLTSQLLANQNKMLSYQDQIDMKWKRKTLELQYKTLFIQRKQLDVSEQSLAYSKEALGTIVSNTGLPDAVKINNMELAGRMMSEKLYGSAIDHFSTLPSNLLQNSVKNIKSKFKEAGSSFREAVDEALALYEEAEDNSDVIEDQGNLDRINMGGQLAGGPLAGYIGKKLGKRFYKKYGDSAGVKHGGDILSSTMSRLPRMFGDMIKNEDTGSPFFDMLIELTDLGSQVRSKNGVVSENTRGKLDAQVYFDLLTKKSITEIIPGYLARIHHEIRSIRTGDDTQSMISYDFDKSVFSNDDAITKTLKGRVFSGRAKRALNDNHSNLIDSLGLDELDPEIRDKFLSKFNMSSINNNDFTLKTLLDEDSNDLTDEQKAVYAEFIESKFGLTVIDPDTDRRGITGKIKDGISSTVRQDANAAKAQRVISDTMNTFQRDMSNPTALLNKFAKDGQLSYALKMGIVDEVDGVYTVNYSKYFDSLKDAEVDEEGPEEEKKDSATKRYTDLKAEEIRKLIDSVSKKLKGSDDTDNADDDDDTDDTDDTEENRTSKKLIDTFNKVFSKQTISSYDEKYGVSEKALTAMEFARKKIGNSKPTKKQLEDLFSSSKEFRDLVRVGVQAKTTGLKTQVNEQVTAIKTNEKVTELQQKADRHISEATVMLEELSKKTQETAGTVLGDDTTFGKTKKKVKDSANKTTAQTKAKIDEQTGRIKEKVFSKSDYAKVESAADKFLDENGIDDSDGSVRESFVKTYIDNHFEGSKAWAHYQKIKSAGNTFANAAKDLAKNAKSTGVNSNVKSAMSILFELTKYTGQAGALLTKPHREALKLIPWGLKKIMGALVEKVNFGHIEHALWLPGEAEPRLLKSGLMNGRYINGKGKVVERPKDLIGDIYDAMQTPAQLVMSQSEYKKGLFDSTGKLIYKPPGIVAKVAGLATGLTKKLAKVAGKMTMGYLKVTTKPASWLINSILREKRIDPKLHAELVQLGLTEQTNKKLDELTETIKDKDKKKFNDKDGDGDRDGSAEDIIENRKAKKGEEDPADKKKGILSRLRDKFKKKKDGDEEDDDEGGGGILGMLGKGKGIGKLLGLAKNPYVMGALAAVGLGGYEAVMDKSKNADPDDIANLVLPEDLKDSLLARIGVRVGDLLVDKIALGTVRTAAKAAVKTGELADRLNKWSIRKGNQAHDGIKKKLNEIPGKVTGFLFGDKAKKFIDAFMNADNILPLFRFRMAQYGFKYNDKQSVEAVLKMEDDIIKTMSVATETAPARIADSITVEESAAYFDVSINNEDALSEWIAWFGNRFRPVFLSVVTVMQRLGYDSKKLHEADSIISKNDKTAMITKTNFNRANENPYDVPTHPLTTESKLPYSTHAAVRAVAEEQLGVIAAMPEDKAALKKEQDRAAKQQTKKKTAAMSRHENTRPDARFDAYAQIDKLTTKNIAKGTRKAFGLNEVPDTTIESKLASTGGGGKFGGGGAGGPLTAESAAAAAAAATTPANKGIIGDMFSGLGGLFVSKAHASAFIPEMQYGGAKTPMGLDTAKGTLTAIAVANKADGSSATGVNDKPVKAARHARKIARSPSGLAARHLRAALQAAGYSFEAPSAASDYPTKALPDMGFIKVTDTGVYTVGDLVVFGSNKNHPFGHICIYDGANWISDHVQDTMNPFDDMSLKHTLWRDADFIQNGTLQPADVKKGAKNSEAVKKAEKALDDLKPPSNSTTEKGIKPAKEDLEKPSLLSRVKDSVSAGLDKVANSSFGQTVSSGYNSLKDKFSNAVASMSGGQKKWQMCVYNAFKTAGFSEQQSRIMTAEIGRENSYNPKYMFAGHADPHSGSNLGMLSWQKSRKTQLIAFLKQAGVLDGANNIKPSQEALDAQARFIMWEMNNTEKASGSKFLPHPNISYKDGVWIIGKYYIRWRIDKAPYAAPGAANRDAFYNMLLKQLNAKDGDASSGNTASPPPATKAANNAPKADIGSFSITDTMAKNGVGLPTAKAAENSPKDPKNVADTFSGKAASGGVPAGSKPAIAAKYARSKALGSSSGYCARYVRTALQKAGYSFTPKPSAYQYAQGTLSGAGFGQISTNTPIQVGDIIVITKTGPHPHGHICIWDGSNWVSDFVQNKWNPYRTPQQYTLWRDRNYLNGASASSGPTSGSGSEHGSKAGTPTSNVGVFGSSSDTAGGTFTPATMKYKDYTGVDEEIANRWKNGSSTPATSSKEDSAKESKATPSANATEKTTTSKPTSTNATEKTTTPTKSTALANTVAKMVENKPDDRATKSVTKVAPAGKAVTVSDVEKQNQKLVENKVTKNLTQRMSQVAAEKSTEQLTESTAILKQSLDTQRRMLDRLNSMDKHLNDMVRGYNNREVVESSSGTVSEDKPVAQKPQHRVNRPGRNEPMSMSKMI